MAGPSFLPASVFLSVKWVELEPARRPPSSAEAGRARQDPGPTPLSDCRRPLRDLISAKSGDPVEKSQLTAQVSDPEKDRARLRTQVSWWRGLRG